jgi:succinoglycan biosynthesis protein ExoA
VLSRLLWGTVASPDPAITSVGASSPGVSVVLPVLNEERHLEATVAAILDTEYPGPLEVILALGPSTDATDDIAAALAAADTRVRAVANPTGRTSAGLNTAIAASHYDIIVRVDGHALIPRDYLGIAVDTLEQTGADNVGGIMGAEGQTDFEKAVAAAMTSWFGVGGAAFHIGGSAGPALTVYLGAFRRTALERVGGFDESMVRAQDWELNHRIRSTGGVVWFTPELHVTYRPRGRVRSLAKQYWQYGRWRREVTRRHPETVSARYLAAPMTVATIAAGFALATIGGFTRNRTLTTLGLIPGLAYAGGNLAASAWLSRDEPKEVRLRVPGALATMHLAWGAGFLRGA